MSPGGQIDAQAVLHAVEKIHERIDLIVADVNDIKVKAAEDRASRREHGVRPCPFLKDHLEDHKVPRRELMKGIISGVISAVVAVIVAFVIWKMNIGGTP